METSFDAVIIGAGPAGSAAAIWLARAGWSVALVEKQAFPRRKVCGECMAASNRPLQAEDSASSPVDNSCGGCAPDDHQTVTCGLISRILAKAISIFSGVTG